MIGSHVIEQRAYFFDDIQVKLMRLYGKNNNEKLKHD